MTLVFSVFLSRKKLFRHENTSLNILLTCPVLHNLVLCQCQYWCFVNTNYLVHRRASVLLIDEIAAQTLPQIALTHIETICKTSKNVGIFSNINIRCSGNVTLVSCLGYLVAALLGLLLPARHENAQLLCVSHSA